MFEAPVMKNNECWKILFLLHSNLKFKFCVGLCVLEIEGPCFYCCNNST